MKNIFTTTKKRFLSLVLVVMTVLTMVPVTQAKAASTPLWGGLRIAHYGPVAVYEDENCTVRKGTVYQYEGYTVLNKTTKGFEIQYSNSNGAQHGYTQESIDEYACGHTGLARIKNTTNVYYGTSTTVNPVAGTVYAGEYVAILAKNDDWAYIEYDTSSGRKRGYIYYGHLDVIHRYNLLPDIYMHSNPGKTQYIDGTFTIYSGPSSKYAAIGSVSNENVTLIAKVKVGGNYSVYIEYNVGNQRKGGFFVFDKYPLSAAALANVTPVEGEC